MVNVIELLDFKGASEFASKFLHKNVTTSNIAYLVDD